MPGSQDDFHIRAEIGTPRVLAFILARAGSKGLPGKNIADLAGRPLIQWSADAANRSALVDAVVVSTDGQDIADVARAGGTPVMMRPDDLASDTALPKDAIRHHRAELDALPDVVVLLQPTSPLRLPSDIDACVAPVLGGEADSAATFVKSTESPYRAWRVENGGAIVPAVAGHDPWRPRQALPPTYRLNGAVYAVRTDIFLCDDSHSFLPGRARMVEMPAERSHDIDVQADLDAVADVLRRKG